MAQSLPAARKHTESSPIHHARLTRPPAEPGLGWFRTARLAIAALMLLAPLLTHADIIHVDGEAGGNDDGTSWTDAYTDLQNALGAAVSDDEIWVATGVYKPVVPADTDNVTETEREATFQLKNGVEVYGGFAGMESQRDERDPEMNVTVLSGDIDNNDTTDADDVVVDAGDIAGDNSVHVVTGSGTDDTAILDGFAITAGNASMGLPDAAGGGLFNDNGDPILVNVTFSGNSAISNGGGMYNGDSSPTLTDITFSGNSAGSGGGIYNHGSSPILTNVSFSSNSVDFSGGGMFNLGSSNPILTNVTLSGNSADRGGGIYNEGSSPILTNVSFSGNSAGTAGGGMSNIFSSSPTLTNVIFSGNSADHGGGVSNSNASSPDIRNTIFWNNQDRNDVGTADASIVNDADSSPTISYSLVQGCNPGDSWNIECGTDGDNNLEDSDPLLVDTPDPNAAPTTAGNLRPQVGSPVIDAGNDGFINDIDNATDLDGKPRKLGDAVDLGPYESVPDLLFKDRFEAEAP